MTTRRITFQEPLNKRDVVALSGALVRQMQNRQTEMRSEGAWAFGLPTPDDFKNPPDWVAVSARIALTGESSLKLQMPTSADVMTGLGGITGMAKMWAAVLESPPFEEAALGSCLPEFQEFTDRIKKMITPSVRRIHKFEKRVDRVTLKPNLQLAYLKGKTYAANEVLREDGSLRDDYPIRNEVCYWLWLYWPQIKLLGSSTELMRFFQVMRQDAVTKANLDKICREVGLKFKGKGRPKKLLTKRRK